jgi:hypothetical protein
LSTIGNDDDDEFDDYINEESTEEESIINHDDNKDNDIVIGGDNTMTHNKIMDQVEHGITRSNYPKSYVYRGLVYLLPNHQSTHSLWDKCDGISTNYHLAYQNMSLLKVIEQINAQKDCHYETGMNEYLSSIPINKQSTSTSNNTTLITSTDTRSRALSEILNYSPTDEDVASFVSLLSNDGAVTGDSILHLMKAWYTMVEKLKNSPSISLMELVLLTPIGFLAKNEKDISDLTSTQFMSSTEYESTMKQVVNVPFAFASTLNSSAAEVSEVSQSSYSPKKADFKHSRGMFANEGCKLNIGGVETYGSFRSLKSTDPLPLNSILVNYYNNVTDGFNLNQLLERVLDKNSRYYLDLYRNSQVLLKKFIVKVCEMWIESKQVPDSILNVVSHMEQDCDDLMNRQDGEFNMGCVHVDFLTYLLVKNRKSTSIGVYALLKLIETKDDSGYFDINQELGKLFSTKYNVYEPLLPKCKLLIENAKKINSSAVASKRFYHHISAGGDNKLEIVSESMVMTISFGGRKR